MKRTKTWLVALGLGLTIATLSGASTEVSDTVHTAQTIVHYVGRVIEIAQKYQQIVNQYQQIVHQLQALEKLDEHFEREVASTASSMEAILSGGLVPTHMNRGVQQIHIDLFPGWELPEDYWRDEEKALTAALKTARRSLGAQNQAHRTSVDHLEMLAELKRQIREAEGTEQALEALAGLVAYHAEVSTLAEISAATSADAPNAYYSYMLNAHARQAKAMQAALDNSNLVPPTWEPGDGWGALPSWWH